jgi:hypothetical protein
MQSARYLTGIALSLGEASDEIRNTDVTDGPRIDNRNTGR